MCAQAFMCMYMNMWRTGVIHRYQSAGVIHFGFESVTETTHKSNLG